MVVGLLGNESPDSNRFTLVTLKSENDVRLQATLGNQNPTGSPVRAVSDCARILYYNENYRGSKGRHEGGRDYANKAIR